MSVLFQRLRGLVQSCMPGSDLELFGSLATDLSLPQSDIDLVALHNNAPDNNNNKKNNTSDSASESSKLSSTDGIAMLRRIAAKLRECTWIRDVKSIETASVPVIKLHVDLGHASWGSHSGNTTAGQDKDVRETCVEVDISFFHSPRQNTEYVKEQLARFRQLRPLVLVLKR
jgi:DNA polymerase sigma